MQNENTSNHHVIKSVECFPDDIVVVNFTDGSSIRNVDENELICRHNAYENLYAGQKVAVLPNDVVQMDCPVLTPGCFQWSCMLHGYSLKGVDFTMEEEIYDNEMFTCAKEELESLLSGDGFIAVGHWYAKQSVPGGEYTHYVLQITYFD